MPSEYMILRDGAAQRFRRGRYYTCEICSREFYVQPSRIRQVERQGARIRFCSQDCYSLGKKGDGNPYWGKKHTPEMIAKITAHPNWRGFDVGRDNPNYARWGEFPHRESTAARWRRLLAVERGLKCERCSYDTVPDIIILHHVDRDRKNNVRSNLMLLCPNCHELVHFEAGDGRYSKQKGKRKKATTPAP